MTTRWNGNPLSKEDEARPNWSTDDQAQVPVDKALTSRRTIALRDATQSDVFAFIRDAKVTKGARNHDAASDITVSRLDQSRCRRRSISCLEDTYYSGLSEGGHQFRDFMPVLADARGCAF